MKPTTIRNRTIYQATEFVKSRQLCGHLSEALSKKYNKRSVRVTEGDTVKVLRGEFKGVTGKITAVSTAKNGVSIEGIKKEKLKGGNLDVFIHPSNLLVTDLNTEDKWRTSKLEGKKAKPSAAPQPAKPKEEKPKSPAKEEAQSKGQEKTKESKAAKTAKKEDN